MTLTKKELKQKASAITTKVDEHAEDVNSEFFKKFKIYWEIINPVLDTIQVFTPDKVDKIIQDIQLVGNDICDPEQEENAEIIEKYCLYWPTIKPILKIIKLVTPRKVDIIIDEFVKLSDLVYDAD